jgi:uncharacterized membrane protein YfbV (UPF0208 family)
MPGIHDLWSGRRSMDRIAMTLEDWDQKVSPHLQFIEAGAAMAARHARQLVAKPDFDSLAEDELDKAFRVLAAALDQIITARKAYKNAPVVA